MGNIPERRSNHGESDGAGGRSGRPHCRAERLHPLGCGVCPGGGIMKLWEQRARLPEVNNIEDYCFILTKNASLNYLEKENRHPTLSSEQLPEVSGQADSPEDTLISEELFARYVKALDRLPERCREVFIRLREEKQSYAQVAEELNISTKTVDAQLQKALTRLKEALLTE